MQNGLDIAAELRAARKAMRLSQAQLALLAGVSRQPIYQLEKGSQSVKLETVLRILDVMGLELRVRHKGDR